MNYSYTLNLIIPLLEKYQLKFEDTRQSCLTITGILVEKKLSIQTDPFICADSLCEIMPIVNNIPDSNEEPERIYSVEELENKLKRLVN